MEETISLKELFQTIRKRLWLIAIITIILTVAVGAISFFVLTPTYQSSTQILVNQSASEPTSVNSTDIRTNLDLISTYNVIIKSPRILDIVKEDLELTRSVGAINGQIAVGSEGNSQVVRISVVDTDPAMAVEIANTTANVFKEEIVKIMNVDNVSILSAAELVANPSPVKPNPLLNMAIAMVVGLMIGVGLTFLLDYLDNTVKSEQDIERLLELPVLGSITQIDLEAEANSSVSSTRVRGESLGS